MTANFAGAPQYLAIAEIKNIQTRIAKAVSERFTHRRSLLKRRLTGA